MATLKQIRQRIRTSKNIQQITRAMKLVAAARLKKAQDRVEQARPYSEKMRELMESIGRAGDLPAHPLLERRPVKRYCLVVVAGDRGLAGSYNSSILRAASDYLKATPGDHVLVTVGKKGAQFFGKRGHQIVHEMSVPTAGANLEDAVSLRQRLENLFTSGEVDAIHLVYSKFISPIRQIPQVVQLLPIEPPQAEAGEEPAGGTKTYKFKPSPAELLEQLLPAYLQTLTYQALLESAASEHGARMTAMTSATDNAGEMIKNLTLQANRARQANITKEILEIVGGAEALNN